MTMLRAMPVAMPVALLVEQCTDGRTDGQNGEPPHLRNHLPLCDACETDEEISQRLGENGANHNADRLAGADNQGEPMRRDDALAVARAALGVSGG